MNRRKSADSVDQLRTRMTSYMEKCGINIRGRLATAYGVLLFELHQRFTEILWASDGANVSADVICELLLHVDRLIRHDMPAWFPIKLEVTH